MPGSARLGVTLQSDDEHEFDTKEAGERNIAWKDIDSTQWKVDHKAMIKSELRRKTL